MFLYGDTCVLDVCVPTLILHKHTDPLKGISSILAAEMRILSPRRRIKIALRLWMPVLVLRIVVVQPLVRNQNKHLVFRYILGLFR